MILDDIKQRIKDIERGLTVKDMPKDYYKSMHNRLDELRMIIKLFAIPAVSLDDQNGKDVCEHPIKFVVWCDEDKMYWCNKCERYV